MLTAQRSSDGTPDVPAAAAGAQIAVITSYSDLHSALRARVDALNVSRRNLDELTGLTGGMSEKLLGPGQIRRFGWKSFGAMLSALGVKLIMVENQEAPAILDAPQRVIHQVRQRRTAA